MKAAQKSDGSFLIKKVISQAEGIWKYNNGNDDSRDNGHSQWLRLTIKIIIFKWVLESSDRGIFGDTGKHSAGQETASRGQRRHNPSARPDQVLNIYLKVGR